MPESSLKSRDESSRLSVYIIPGDTAKESYRLSTYVKFPSKAPVDPCTLANHGFSYTGYKDRVKCFSCGAIKEDWSVGNDPRSREWHFSDCELLLGTDTSNKPIDRPYIQFVGTFGSWSERASTSTSSVTVNSSYSTAYSSSSDELEELMNDVSSSPRSLPAVTNAPDEVRPQQTGPRSMIDVPSGQITHRPDHPLVKVNPARTRRAQQRMDAAPSGHPRSIDAAFSRHPRRTDAAPSTHPKRTGPAPSGHPRITDAAPSEFPWRTDAALAEPPLRTDTAPSRHLRRTDANFEAHLSLETQRATDAATSGFQTSSWSDSSHARRRLNPRQRRTKQKNSLPPAANMNNVLSSGTDDSSCYTAASTSTGSSQFSQVSDTESASSVGTLNNSPSVIEKRSERHTQDPPTVSQLENMGFDRAKIKEAIRKKGRQTSFDELLDFLLLQDKEREDDSFTTPPVRSESTPPADPPPAYSNFIPISYPNPMQPGPATMGLSQLRSQHLTLPQFGGQPLVVLCDSSSSRKDEEPKCDVLMIRNASEATAREGIMGFFQLGPSQKKG